MVLLTAIRNRARQQITKKILPQACNCQIQELYVSSPIPRNVHVPFLRQLHYHSNTTSVKKSNEGNDDPNMKWKAWFQSHEYQPIWSKHPIANSSPNQVQPLPHTILDNSSRLLLSQLDEITHSVDVNRSIDVPTILQCNTIIKRLGDKNEGGKELEGRSLRAYLIWKKMEYCVDVRQDLHASTPSPKFHYSLPRPNRQTYLAVLSLHATDIEQGRKGDAPNRALEIVKKMEERFKDGYWDAEPSRMIWNQVIASWANTSHAEKGYEAANILKNHMGDIADASTFGNVFRACATTAGDSRAKELAGKVALRVWAEFIQSNLMPMKDEDGKAHSLLFDRGSYTFVYAMKAVQLVADEQLRRDVIKAQFEAACKLGLVNTHVLHALRSVASPDYASTILGKYGSKKAKTAHLFRKIPKGWKRNCKTNTAGW
jgi:hypothetical protein